MDEGHLGANGSSVLWVLTGTPIQDAISDLFPLGCSLHLAQLRVLSSPSVVMLRRLKVEMISDLVSKTVYRRRLLRQDKGVVPLVRGFR